MASFATIRRGLIEAALALPEAYLDHPWGEDAAKVRNKIFVGFGRRENAGLVVWLKLPESGPAALTLDAVSPSGYGLGKSGWVDAVFTKASQVDTGLVREWIEESYRAVAPKRLVRLLDGEGSP